MNTIMQSAFFKLTNIIPFADAVKYMKTAIEKSYGKKGPAVLEMNYSAVDSAEKGLEKFEIPASWATCDTAKCAGCKGCGNKYFDDICAPINALKGDSLPVSAFTADGTVPTGTTQY